MLEGLNVFRSARDAERMRGCQQTLSRGFAASKATDTATHAFWAQLNSEEKVSGGWYRATYSLLTGKRPGPVPLPLLAPEQVIRRAESARGTSPEPAVCVAVV